MTTIIAARNVHVPSLILKPKRTAGHRPIVTGTLETNTHLVVEAEVVDVGKTEVVEAVGEDSEEEDTVAAIEADARLWWSSSCFLISAYSKW
jgi:hypothetical protein